MATFTVVLGSTIYRPSSENMDEAKLEAHFDAADYGVDKPITSDDISYFTWLRYLLSQHKLQPAAQEKRFTGMGMPYVKYQSGKRNNGIWIWMPAQGYVSVPQQQHALTAASENSENPGKVMRYGK